MGYRSAGTVEYLFDNDKVSVLSDSLEYDFCEHVWRRVNGKIFLIFCSKSFWKKGPGPTPRQFSFSSRILGNYGLLRCSNRFSPSSLWQIGPWNYKFYMDVLECRHLHHPAQTLFEYIELLVYCTVRYLYSEMNSKLDISELFTYNRPIAIQSVSLSTRFFVRYCGT